MEIVNNILGFILTMIGVMVFTFIIYIFYYGAIHLANGNEKKKNANLLIAVFIMTCIYLLTKDMLIEIISIDLF